MEDDSLTPKGRRSRDAILDAAAKLFTSRGYEGATLRAIAKEAGVSPGLAYRYFDGKDALVAGLYARLTERFDDALRDLPDGRWVPRSRLALDASFTVLGPYRDTLSSLVTPSRGTAADAIFAPVAVSHQVVRAGFLRAVTEATDAPGRAELLGETIYLAHLGMLLFWLLDRSPDQEATAALRAWTSEHLGTLGLVLSLPVIRGPLVSLVEIAKRGVFGPEPSREEAS